MAASTTNTANAEKKLSIASLGSSYASGPGIRPQKSKLAMRSGHNYASILSERLNATLTDLTVSGATLGNVLNEPQAAYLFKKMPPQLEGLPRDVDIVTLTGGGNDLNYDNAIFRDVLKSRWYLRPFQKLIPVPGEGQGMKTEDLVAKFTDVIDKIHEINPNARIVLVEYFTLLGPNTKPWKDIRLTQEQMDYHRGIAEDLAKAYKLAAKARPNVELIPVKEISQDHALGSSDPWLTGFSLKMIFKAQAPFHPNSHGMEAVADILYERLTNQTTGEKTTGEANIEVSKHLASKENTSEA